MSRPRNARASGQANGADRSATQRRLLDAAERLFAEKGFADTSVRELTAEAGANLAAVNYHFGGKENLYVEVFRRGLDEMREHRLASIQAAVEVPDPTLESLLRAFGRSFMEPFMEAGRGRRLMQLYNREMIQPMLPPRLFYEHMVEPVLAAMSEAIASICPDIDRRDIMLCQHWFVGQLLHAVQMDRHYREAGIEAPPMTDLREAIDHMVRFTAAGMRGFAGEPTC